MFYGGKWWNMSDFKIPNIKIYKDRKSFRVKWWADQIPYAIVFKSKVEATLASAQIRLAMSGAKEWPSELLVKSAVQKFLNDRYLHINSNGNGVVEEYIEVIKGEVSEGWLKFTRKCLEDLEESAALDSITLAEAQKYISGIGQKQTVSTRNKKLLVIKKFYNWAMSTHFWPQNPFADIKKLRNIRINTDIHYLTRTERSIVLEKTVGLKHGLAVWIALYTGMRQGEVFTLKWDDINLEAETIVAQSKGGACRTVPLAAQLMDRLREETVRSGYLFDCHANYKDVTRWLIDSLRRDLKDKIEPACIGWNPFRHTFCTLLVQNGVSLDKVAMWAGHSQKICKQHYARFIPKDQKDSDIDRL